MDAKKHQRAKAILKELVADFLERISNRRSLITVTELVVTEKEDHARILISVLPESQEQAAVNFVTRNLTELRAYISKKSSLRSIPYFYVAIDPGEKNRQEIEALLAKASVKNTPRPKTKKKVS